MFDRYAILFDACAQVGLADPHRVRALELRDIAAILGMNRAPVEDHMVWPADAPISAATARNSLAASEGRERVRATDPPPSREEWQRMVALAQSAKKQAG